MVCVGKSKMREENKRPENNIESVSRTSVRAWEKETPGESQKMGIADIFGGVREQERQNTGLETSVSCILL